MDVLSEVLKVVKLEGALYYNGEFTAPWGFRAPPSSVLAPYFAPGGGHVIIYHLLTEGRGFAGLEHGNRVPLTAGDIVIFPHGDSHVIGNGAPVEPVDQERELHRIFTQGLKLARAGGGGEVTKLVCGYMSCDPHLSRVFLAGLPAVLKVNVRDGAAGQWLESSIRFSVQEADASRAGGEAVMAKLSEVLFVETLRRYITELPPEQTGWLAGARAILKSEKRSRCCITIPLNLGQLPIWRVRSDCRVPFWPSASAINLGEPPISYLTRWRLQPGAQMLKSSSRSVAEVAAEVGYESEAAFNRAFKREYRVPPARFRTESRAGEKASSSANADALRLGRQV
jgi:hypothetical protein